MDKIKIFSPATVANISCGFDVLGLCLDTIGDEMIIRKTKEKDVRISKIVGQILPLDPDKNVAGVAVKSLLQNIEVDCGFDIEIHKNIKPGSGIGSSAASAAGAVFGVNKLLGEPFSLHELIAFAMEGEKLASSALHADNVAPALLGGFTLIRSYNPLEVIKINAPKELFVTVIHPQIEIKTSEARAVLPKNMSLQKNITQLGNLGGLISGLYTENYDLIGRSLHDEIAEPYRSALIPNFDTVKENVQKVGALGSGISGSGPSIFALSKGKETAEKVAKAMAKVYKNTNIDFDVHVSKVNSEGIKILE
ncbi:homoserine kinase [Tenacibaculum sp. IB213877]|uniref:homoserine kinase n=1 Tax=Tenacibaculum sp. IB213877 TaxID=3097351 RepID=UPI002A59A622|nr:homoserine kinase [Tenacibaculum sp. IB213877]MDY0779398.1 homoserine kinase [Tenacibaculum sp. IB213877]